MGVPGAAAAAMAAALSSQSPPAHKPAPSVSHRPGGAIRGPCFVKLLVPDRAAGVIIGKGGSGIAELEAETGASMRLSGSRVYFPGTSERVMVCGGEMSSLERLIPLIVSKLNETEAIQMRLVLPNSACSALIGKGGETIKALAVQTGAAIRVSDRDATQERIVDIKSGSAVCAIQAIVEITHRVQEDPSFKDLVTVLNYQTEVTTGGPGSQYYFNGSSLAAAAAAAGAQAAVISRQTTSLVDQYPIAIEFSVPSSAVGAIIGKNGEARNRIVHATGANVVVSDRSVDPERKINISGPLAAVQAALTLVAKLVVDSQ